MRQNENPPIERGWRRASDAGTSVPNSALPSVLTTVCTEISSSDVTKPRRLRVERTRSGARAMFAATSRPHPQQYPIETSCAHCDERRPAVGRFERSPGKRRIDLDPVTEELTRELDPCR